MLCALVSSSLVVRAWVVPGVTPTISLSKRTASKISMATQDELKKQVGYQAIDDYVGSRVPGGAPRGSAPRAPRRPMA